MEIPQEVKNSYTIWSNNSTIGCLPKESENTNLKRYKHLYVDCRITYNRQDMEATCKLCPSIDEWIRKKENVVCIHTDTDTQTHTHTLEFYIAIKKGRDHTIWDNMDRSRRYDKWNKSYWERQIPYDFTHKWTLKNKWINKKQNQTYKYRNKLMVARGEGGRRLGKMSKEKWEIQASSYWVNKSCNKRHSIRNTVNDIIIVIYWDTW